RPFCHAAKSSSPSPALTQLVISPARGLTSSLIELLPLLVLSRRSEGARQHDHEGVLPGGACIPAHRLLDRGGISQSGRTHPRGSGCRGPRPAALVDAQSCRRLSWHLDPLEACRKARSVR